MTNTSYPLRINNGGLADVEFEKISSSFFILNGVQIKDFPLQKPLLSN